jgi:hypothetical protein
MDSLYDLLAHVPGYFEDISSSCWSQNHHIAQRLSLEVVEDLQQQLQAWRLTWDSANSAVSSSRLTPMALNSATVEQLLEFTDTSETAPPSYDLSQALELLTFNATSICLSNLRQILAARGATSHRHEVDPTSHSGTHPSSSAETQISIETAREIVQQCAYIVQEIGHRGSVNFLALAPVGIVYCALKGMGGLGSVLAASLARMFHAERSLAELEVFESCARGI